MTAVSSLPLVCRAVTALWQSLTRPCRPAPPAPPRGLPYDGELAKFHETAYEEGLLPLTTLTARQRLIATFNHDRPRRSIPSRQAITSPDVSHHHASKVSSPYVSITPTTLTTQPESLPLEAATPLSCVDIGICPLNPSAGGPLRW